MPTRQRNGFAAKGLILPLIFLLFLINSTSYGQAISLDSCGLDKNPRLTKFELDYFDQVLFADSIHDFKKGFKFAGKNICFFTCDASASQDGFVTKDKFFDIGAPSGYRGPRGIYALTEEQKQNVGPVDAVVIIQCKEYSDKDLIDKLRQRKITNNKLPGQ
jgi:hypothetical protein